MLDFPTAPSVGQLYPAAPVAGVPTYRWDGEKWKIGSPPSSAVPSATLPLMDSVAGPGTAIQWSRGDHVHPTDTVRAPVASPTFTGTLTAQTFVVSGNMTVGGMVRTSADQNHIGNHIDSAGVGVAWDNVLPQDANIIFYDYGGGNWAGIGADQGGNFWVRTGGGGSNAVSAMVATVNNVHFTGLTYAPTAPNGTNNQQLATTAYVIANQPAGGPYLPLSGGTINGTLTVLFGHIMPYRNGATGVLYFGTAPQDRYIYYDGTNYVFGSGVLNTAAGRIWGTSDFGQPVTGARIGPHAGDVTHASLSGLNEPFAGAVSTGSSQPSNIVMRYRYNQIYTNAWYTAGYA